MSNTPSGRARGGAVLLDRQRLAELLRRVGKHPRQAHDQQHGGQGRQRHAEPVQHEPLLREQKAAVVRKQAELQRVERKIDNRLRQLHDAQTAALGAIRLVRSPACRIVWMSGALELHSFLDMEPSIRMLERSQAEAVVFLGKVGVGLSAERLLAGAFAPYDRAFLVLDDEDAFDGDVTTLPETTCAAVCFRGSHPEAPAQYARLMDYLHVHALAPADFSREITMIDYGLTSDPEKFVTEIRIPVTET